MGINKKRRQLGMNPSTASGRLIKDLLFKFIQLQGYKCFQCGGDLTRETFSIEHKVPWLDSEDPVKLFFDLNNIAFSHQKCNIGAGRREKSEHGTVRRYDAYGCRCVACKQAESNYRKSRYTTDKRRKRYIETGQ